MASVEVSKPVISRQVRRKQERLAKKAAKKIVSFSFDPRCVYRNFEKCVLEDIATNGYPAYAYNFVHKTKQINTFDLESQWDMEMDNLNKQGWVQTKVLTKTINIGDVPMNCEIILMQPVNEDGTVNMNKLSNVLIDPLGCSVELISRGYCYIKPC